MTDSNADGVLAGGGELGARMRALDWTATPLGATGTWPQSLRSALSICLNSAYPIALYWGPELALLYNDAWSPILGSKHPWALGRPGRDVWPEIWDAIGPLFERVEATGEGVWQQDEFLPMNRHGYTEECYFNFTFSPIRGESGRVEGVFNAVVETTYRVIGERRARVLRTLAERTAGARSVDEACALATEVLATATRDVPFALLYLLDETGETARLAGVAGLPQGGPASPVVVPLTAADDHAHDVGSPWPLARVSRTGVAEVVSDLGSRVGPLPAGPWEEPPHTAVVLPVAGAAQTRPIGLLVAGVSPRRALGDEYRDFFDQLARHAASALLNARAYEEERRRAEALAELDRAKTAFFSNVSHELRTPLTLMLGPTEDLLAGAAGEIAPAVREQLALLHRNELRLLKLVNTLLDFSRIEAGRMQAVYEPTDLAAYTAELASTFRSAVERAGLRLTIDAPPPPDGAEPAYVDRDMWEKIVLNLLANAFKHTFEGAIAVTVRSAADRAELTVRDTGVGIPHSELPHLFERFHRVPNARSRTHEGSGIGLALVQELVRLHGGEIAVASEEGAGSTFTVRLPLGAAHLPAGQVGARRALPSTAVGSIAYTEQALRWLPDGPPADGRHGAQDGIPDLDATPALARSGEDGARAGTRILIVDDNADMREYASRLLHGRGWTVDTATDGETALAMAQRRRPDLVLSDVMMPKLDGFGLLKALRADAGTRDVPVILLSARAGEESRVEGLDAGADDYLVKPFSARELLARVGAHLSLAAARQESLRAVEQAHAELAETHERLRDQAVELEASNQQLQEQAAELELQAEELQATSAELERRTEEAEEANRAKSEFLATMSHELRTPLNAIAGYAQLMQIGVPEPAPASHQDYLVRIQQSQGRLLGLINEVLNFARIEAGRVDYDVTDVAVSEILASVEPLLTPQIRAKGQTYRCDACEQTLQLRGDRDKVVQILLNLVSNAVKFTPAGGAISIGAEAVDDRTITIRVRDTGIGIPPDKLQAIFDPFVQVDATRTRTGDGAGLGLAISRDLARGMGGDLTAESRPGEGSTFTLTLPRA